MSSQDKTPGARTSGNSYALRTKRLSLSAILAAMAMILSYIEALIPMPVPVPGIKLGLANLIVIIDVYKRQSLSILIISFIISSAPILLFLLVPHNRSDHILWPILWHIPVL